MRPIAILYCGGGLNLGNEFINGGGHNLVKKLFPDSPIYAFEVMDSAAYSWSYPSPPLLPGQIRWINDHCVAAFMMGGSILTPAGLPLMSLAESLTIPKILLGAGCYIYDDMDKKVAEQASDMYDAIVTRDDVTASYIPHGRVIEGIDLAFWFAQCTDHHDEYAVVNLDQNFGMEYNQRRREELLDLGYPEVWIIENTHNTPRNVQGYIQVSYGWQLWNLYAQAAMVETCRIHTSLACLANHTKFTYRGSDQGGQTGRNTLFNKVGITLLKDTAYDPVAIQSKRDIILARENVEKLIEKALWDILQ